MTGEPHLRLTSGDTAIDSFMVWSGINSYARRVRDPDLLLANIRMG